MKEPATPFPRHWVYYIAIKLIILAAALLFALHYFGYWSFS